MAHAVIVLAEGFEEIEAVTIADVLRRSGVSVTLASLGGERVEGSHAIVLAADASLDQLRAEDYQALILPGGMPGAKHLAEDSRVLDWVRSFVTDRKLTAAICAAPTVLEAAGVLEGVRATSYPGYELPSADYRDDRVVEDGWIVTSRGPGTAIEFSLALVRRLVGPDRSEKIGRALLVEDR